MNRRSLHKGRVGDFGIETVTLPNGNVVDLEILRHPGAADVVSMPTKSTITLLRPHRHTTGGTIWE
ncbi:MAG: NUDIX hydrolase, partial [Myxococcota bacterium]